MDEITWPAEWTRATLSQTALAIIGAEGTTYGYRILQRLEAAGFGKVKGGTLYPILARLEAEGLISSSWGKGEGGPGRKFVSITDAGRAEIARSVTRWQEFATLISTIWSGDRSKEDA
jgi:PadR family transcriptional regulator, regulatory protein PadR